MPNLTDRQKKEKLYILLKEKRNRELRNNYAKYVQHVHEGRWYPGKHLLFICDKVQKLVENQLYQNDQQVKILIIQMPPQHGKSQSITETLPSWYLGKYPYKRVIEASYNDDLAQRFGRRNRDKIKNFGKDIFNIELSSIKNTNEEYELSNGVGGMISRGIMSGITGNPGDLIIIDDPIKNRQEAESETYRERIWDEWQNSIKTRMSANAKVILIMTRWHEDDLAGRILLNEQNVMAINLPCEAEENDVLGRTPGDALFPEIGKDKEWLQAFKHSYINDINGSGEHAWNALYQGRPSSRGGNLFKRRYFKYWKFKGTELPPITVQDENGNYINIEPVDLPQTFDEMLQSWDCTFKEEKDNDFVAGGTFGRKAADIFLLDCINARMDIVKTMQAIHTMTVKYPKALRKLIEDKANGPAVIQMLRRKIPGIIPVTPEGGKLARASAIAPAIESGNYYVPHPAIFEWVNQYLTQMCDFPKGKNDDMVDMATQALNRLIFNYVPKNDKPLPDGFASEEELKDMGYTKNEIRRVK